MAFQLRDNQQVPVVVEALDSEGNAAAATFTWTSDDETIAAVTDQGNGAATIVASPGAGGLGTTTIHVLVTDNATADTIEGTLDIEVVASDAVVVNITPSAPQPKP